ncbi:MAG: ABC transporter permease [Bacillota bacterium]
MHKSLQAIRKMPTFLVSTIVSLLAIVFALLVGAVLIALTGVDPWLAYWHFFYGIFGTLYGMGETLSKFVPMLFCALGFSLAQKSGFFNMGGEGQLYCGAICAVLVGAYLPGITPAVHIALAILAGFLGGALCCAIAGAMKIFFRSSELLNTMMLNYIVTLLVAVLVSGALKDPAGMMNQTKATLESAKLPIIFPGTRLHAGFIIVIVITVAVWFFFQRTTPGFEMRLSGINPKAANYAGVNARKTLMLAIVISGGLAGMGGAIELIGNQYRLLEGFSSGYGFDAIGIAVMGQYHPVGIALSAFLFAAMRVGAGAMQRGVGVPLPLVSILQGIIIVSVIVSAYYVRKVSETVVGGRA